MFFLARVRFFAIMWSYGSTNTRISCDTCCYSNSLGTSMERRFNMESCAVVSQMVVYLSPCHQHIWNSSNYLLTFCGKKISGWSKRRVERYKIKSIFSLLWYTGWVPEKYRRTPNVACTVCGKLIYRRPYEVTKTKGKFFCSSVCYGISCRKEILCIVCSKPILSGLRKTTCSRNCANINRTGIIYKIGRPKDKARLQRALKIKLLTVRGKKCERCFYSRHEILQVHHKDRNRSNGSLDNLELICPNCHCEEHYLEKSWLKNTFEKIKK